MRSPSDQKAGKSVASAPSLYRWLLVILILLLVSGYTVALITGAVNSANKIDAVDLGLIALAVLFIMVLVHPEVLRQIKILKLGNSLEFELREIKDVQSDQQSGLDGVRMVLSILLPEKERRHLLNLLNDTTSNYQGGYFMRTELRHLESLELICMRSNRDVEDMRSNMIFDLDDYAQLTDLGKKSAQMIRSAADARAEDEKKHV